MVLGYSCLYPVSAPLPVFIDAMAFFATGVFTEMCMSIAGSWSHHHQPYDHAADDIIEGEAEERLAKNPAFA